MLTSRLVVNQVAVGVLSPIAFDNRVALAELMKRLEVMVFQATIGHMAHM